MVLTHHKKTLLSSQSIIPSMIENCWFGKQKQQIKPTRSPYVSPSFFLGRQEKTFEYEVKWQFKSMDSNSWVEKDHGRPWQTGSKRLPCALRGSVLKVFNSSADLLRSQLPQNTAVELLSYQDLACARTEASTWYPQSQRSTQTFVTNRSGAGVFQPRLPIQKQISANTNISRNFKKQVKECER